MRVNLINFCIASALFCGDCVGESYHSMPDLREIQLELSDAISAAESLDNPLKTDYEEDEAPVVLADDSKKVGPKKSVIWYDESSDKSDEIEKLKNKCSKYKKIISALVEKCKSLQEKIGRYQKKYEKYKDRGDKKKEENAKLKQLLKSEQEEKAQIISGEWFNAAKSGNYEEMKRLVDQVPEINCQDEKGNTALILAVEKGHEDVVKLLLQQYLIDVNAGNENGRTSLSAAIISGNKNIVEMLVEARARITEEALSTAVELENKEIVEILLDHYSGPDRKQVLKRVLENAINDGNDEMVSLLTRKDAYVNKENKDGVTPLMTAANSGEIAIVQQLLTTKVEVNKQDIKGRTSLIYAVDSNMSTAAIVELLAQKADLNIQDQKGRTALMYAASQPNGLVKVKTLLKYGADVSLKDKKGQTALDIAKKNLKEAKKTNSSQIGGFEDIVNALEHIGAK